MHQILPDLEDRAIDADLKALLQKSAKGVKKHTQILKALVESSDGKQSKHHCNGMEGLVKEAKSHVLDSDMKDGHAKDVLIIAQYQRMSHYGLAGFGAATAYAKSLELEDDEDRLETAVAEIHQADDAATKLADLAVNLKARAG